MNEMSKDIVLQSLAALSKRVETLEAEADIRPRAGALYVSLRYAVPRSRRRERRPTRRAHPRALYRGRGMAGGRRYYDNQFGRRVGKAALREYLEAFWGQKRDPALLLNVHYLTRSRFT